MLSHTQRFHGHGSLRRLFQKGTVYRSRRIMVRVLKNPTRNQPRVAIIVSKKVFKSAVKRNRIRRRLFEIVRHELPLISDGHDIAITVFSSEVLTLSHLELTTEMRGLLAPLTRGTIDESTSHP